MNSEQSNNNNNPSLKENNQLTEVFSTDDIRKFIHDMNNAIFLIKGSTRKLKKNPDLPLEERLTHLQRIDDSLIKIEALMKIVNRD